MAKAATLIKISFPLVQRSFSFHPNIFFSILSLMKVKVCSLVLGITEGKPRKKSWLSVIGNPDISDILDCKAIKVLGLKFIVDLFILTSWPLVEEYRWRTFLISTASAQDVDEKGKELSANKKCETFGPNQKMSSTQRLDDLMACDRPLAHRRNTYGDRGSPWRSPLKGIMKLERYPLI